jgi:methionyl-tRNA formyltransferase
MRIVFLTNKSKRGYEILKQLKENNILLDAIFIDIGGQQIKKNLRKLKAKRRRFGFVGVFTLVRKRLRKNLESRSEKVWKKNETYFPFAEAVHIVDSFNGKQCESLLKEISPDIIVLGGSRIIRKHIIDIPKIGILNAHPGLLPKYRGVDVIPWAIYHGDPVGVTIHFINEGIDTGGIIVQKTIPLAYGDSLGKLMAKANKLAGELMVETVLKVIREGHLKILPQKKEEGKQFFRMPLNLWKETEEQLTEMIKETQVVTSD